MECPEQTWVSEFVRGELLAEELSRLEAHLDGCSQCLALVAENARLASDSVEAEAEAQRDSLWVHLVAAFARASDRPVSELRGVRLRERFGPYRVVTPIGRGGMGIVFSAVHEPSGKPAAVKTVVEPTTKSLAAMRLEISFLRREQHPGIVQIFDDGIVDGDPWYAMELLEGRTLEEYNRSTWARRRAPGSGGPTTAPAPTSLALRHEVDGEHVRDVLSIFAKLCAPVSHVHRAGIVHCDLKPANVFLRDGQPILMDFGLLSRATGTVGRETLEIGGLRGTLPYLAPELIRGRIPDGRADLYALGCMIYEGVVGRPPFMANTAHGLLAAHLYTEATPPSSLVSGLPKGFDELVASLLAKQPDRRLGAAEMLEQALEALLARAPRRSAATPTPYLFRPRIVGRDTVIEEIRELRTKVEGGEGQVVVIGGESGIGKTFLASEVAQLAGRAGFEVVTGECMALDPTGLSAQRLVSTALEPFRNLLQRAADRCRERDGVSEIFGSQRTIRLLTRYEPALDHLVEGERDEPAALPPTAERDRVLEAMREVVSGLVARTPLLLVIDDIQWADDLSLAFIESMSPEFLSQNRLLLIALYRSEESSEAIARIQGKKHVRSIALRRLDETALTAMVGDLLARSPPAPLMRALTLHSEGNPFFVAEYLRAAAADGLLVHTTEGWRLSDQQSLAPHGVDGLALPRSLRELLAHRLDLLSPGAQRAVESAAVIGREFPLSMLTAVAGASVGEADAWVQEIVERQLVERVREIDFRFSHDKIRELAYARIDSQHRRELHLRAANVIETTYAAEPQLHYAALGVHFRSGGAPDRAVGYFEKAAEHALRNSANADAVRLFRQAIDTAGSLATPTSLERRALWARRIGDALQGIGSLAESKQHFLEALTLLGHPVPKTGAALGFGITRKLGKQLVHRTVPRRWIRVDDQASQPLLETARSYDRLMQIYYYLGEYAPLFFANLATLDFAERAAPSPTLAVAYTNAAAAAGIVPLPRLAALYFRLAEATLQQAYDPEVDSYVQSLRARYLSGLGHWAEAETAAERVMTLADDLGFRRRWDEGAGIRCDLTWGRDFDDCLSWCDRMFESAARRDDAQAMGWGHLRRAEIHAARGAVDRAEQSLVNVEAVVSGLGRPEQMRALGARSFIQLARGQLDRAVESANQAARLVDEAKTIHPYCVDAYARIAEVFLAAWVPKSSSAAARARSACETLGKAARLFPIAVPRHCLHEGTRQWLLGQKKVAVAAWERGLRAAVALDIPYEEALILHRLAAAHPRAALNPQTAVARGKQIFARLGVDEARITIRGRGTLEIQTQPPE